MSNRTRCAAFVLLVLWTAACPLTASAQTTGPSGWKTEAVGTNAVMTPPGLAPGEFFQITVFPRTSQSGAVITDFLDGFADRDAAALGKLVGAQEPAAAKNHAAAAVSRNFTTASGAARAALYVAISADGENVRVVRQVSSASAEVMKRYQPQMSAIVKYLAAHEKTDAVASGRGLQAEKLPMTPDGMTPGGKIVPGIYAGNAVYSNDGKIGDRFRLYLYASGEFSLCNDKGVEVEFGADDYKYDPITGLLSVGRTFEMNNDRFDPDENFCLYGRGADGKPYLHASSYRGYGWRTTILHYAGPLDRPSPKQLEAQKAAADAEARRYKFVTAPGKGVQTAQIARVLHNQISNLDNGPDKNEVYLLLKDGTIHDGLPVPPDELDAPLSRRWEPEKWGHWRRQGAQYLASWPDQPNHFEPLKGEIVLPAKTGERLAGRFATGSTSGSTLLGGSWSIWGVKFSPGARFQKDSRGGSSSGTMGQTMNDFSVDTVSDDDGSTTSFSTPSTVGFAKRKKTGGHRGGTYSLSGYTLTLHYDDGRTARLPFFFTSARRDGLYFEGSQMTLNMDK